MTIATTTSKVTYQGNGATTNFTFSFVPDTGTDVDVYYTDNEGTTTLLSTSAYTLAINAVPVGGLWGIGGSVTYPISGTAISAGTYLTISRSVPYTQSVSISNQGAFYPKAVEQGLDILELQIQQINTEMGYALKFPIQDMTPPDTLPVASARAGYVLGFDGDGQPEMVYNNDTTITINTITQPILSVQATPPGGPSEGAHYLVAHSGTTGAFVGHEDQLAVWTSGAWVFTTQLLNTELLNLGNSALYHKVIGGWEIKEVYAVPGDNLQTRANTANGATLVFLPGTYTGVNIAFSTNTTVTSTGLVILQTTSTTLPIWDFSNTTDCVVRGRFVLQGSGANATIVNPTGITGLVNTGQVGIKTYDTLRLDIDGDIEIKNISGYAIDEHAPSSVFSVPGSSTFKGLRVHDCYFGAYVREFSEYSTYIGCFFYKNVAGIKDEAGNRSYINCNVIANNYGFFFDGSVEPGNNSHGIVSDCFINHNGITGIVGSNITCDGTQLGMLFTGCQILSDLTGAGHGFINIINGAKIIAFTGCGMGSDVTIDATSQAIFTGNTIRTDLANSPSVASGGVCFGTGNVGRDNTTAFLWNGMGSWAPVLKFGGASTGITYSYQNGRYHVGDGFVTFTGQIALSSKGSATGSASISGLPFTAGAIPSVNPVTLTAQSLNAAVTDLRGGVGASGTSINLYNFNAGTISLLTDASFTGGDVLSFSGSYPLG